jgi:predicted nuclease with TOPRIM domain
VESKTSEAGRRLPASDMGEAVIAELTEEVEHLRHELTRMGSHASALEEDRERLESELATANQWVKLLAEEVEATTARLSAEARPLSARIVRTY